MESSGDRTLGAASERTVNLDLLVLRNVMNAAIDDGHIRTIPKIKLLDEPPRLQSVACFCQRNLTAY